MRVLIMREDPMWVAQCLEHDIAAQGRTIQETKKAFALAFAAQVAVAVAANEDPQAFLNTFGAAPEYYHERFERAERLAEPIRAPEPAEIPPAFMINALQRSLADSRVYA